MTKQGLAVDRGSPLRDRGFAIVWSCIAAAFLAQWMLPVAAQWFLVSRGNGEVLVPFVQVALSLPMALLAIPAGVMADRMDRRRLVLLVQWGVLAVEVALVALAATGSLRPLSLFALLALLACGMAVTFTSLNSMIPDLVATPQIPAAAALMTIATNATRVIGPALGGAILVVASVGVAFAAALPATVLLILALRHLSPTSPAEQSREPWLAAARAGIRYVRHSPQAVKLVLRTFWYSVGAMAMLSLLPVLATRLHASPGQLGSVLAMQGFGAVLGALTLPALSRRALPNRIVTIGFVAGAIGLAIAAWASSLPALAGATVLVGWSWTTSLATGQAGMQVYLPAWVRSRGLSVLLIATFTGQSLGAALSGWIAGLLSVDVSLLGAAVLLLSGAAFAVFLPLKDLAGLDRTAVATAWSGPEIVLDAEKLDLRLQVRVTYGVPSEVRKQFVQAMSSLRRIRLRTGGQRWRLLEDSEVAGRFFEEFMVSSWTDHLRQMDRLVASDQAVEERVLAMAEADPEVHYAFMVDVVDPAT